MSEFKSWPLHDVKFKAVCLPLFKGEVKLESFAVIQMIHEI